MMRKGMKLTALLLAMTTGLASLPVQAVMISTEEATATATALSPEKARLLALLARADVQAGLEQHGVSAAMAEARVAALSDAEAAQLSQHIDETPAGGSVLGVIVFVFLVLLITDILGLTKIFPFTRSVR